MHPLMDILQSYSQLDSELQAVARAWCDLQDS